MGERPARMMRNGREEDTVFEPAEKLFRRYNREHFINGKFSNMGLSFTGPPSVNRQKYGEASDVIFSETDEFAKWGVLSFRVQHVSVALPCDRPEYTFFPKHVPLENNYAHSEVYCVAVSALGAYVEPRPAVRKLFRAALSQRVVIEVEAESNNRAS
jgi:hypothetical protein